MINAELLAKIKAEIERHLNSATEHQNANPDMPKYRWYLYEGEKELCTDLLDYIDDSLESEKPVPADLEEASKDYTDSSEWSIGENLEHIDAAFIAGAKWQEKRNLRFVKQVLSGDFTVFEAGRKYEREQMMKEAMEVPVIEMGMNPSPYIVKRLEDNYKKGDKVHVIVLPKEN